MMGTYEELLTTCIRVMQEDYIDDPPVKNQVAEMLGSYIKAEDLPQLKQALAIYWKVAVDGWEASKILNLSMQTLDSPSVREALIEIGRKIDRHLQHG